MLGLTFLFTGLQYGNPAWIVANPTALAVPDDPYLMLEIHNYVSSLLAKALTSVLCITTMPLS